MESNFQNERCSCKKIGHCKKTMTTDYQTGDYDYDKKDIEADLTKVKMILSQPKSYPTYIFGEAALADPGNVVSKQTSVNLITNSNGCCWLELNWGQFLSSATYKPSVTGVNSTTGVEFGNSNLFISSQASTINGVASYVPGVTEIGQFEASNSLIENLGIFNSVRAGPATLEYDFIGALDKLSGIVYAGINYTFTDDLKNLNTPNGLLPDMNFITSKAIEDCPVSMSTSVSNSFKAVFLPHDISVYNLKHPKKGNTECQQRLFILVVGAPPNESIGTVRITCNFTGKTSSEYADSFAALPLTTIPNELLSIVTKELYQKKAVIFETSGRGFGIDRFLGTSVDVYNK